MLQQIEARITSRTKAIMVVHIFGLPVDMDPVLALAHKHGLKVIEDAAEVHRPDLSRPAVRQLRRRQHLQLLPQQARDHR